MRKCNKRKFETRKQAKKALKEVRAKPLYLKGVFIKKARQYYFCNICQSFHITSKK